MFSINTNTYLFTYADILKVKLNVAEGNKIKVDMVVDVTKAFR